MKAKRGMKSTIVLLAACFAFILLLSIFVSAQNSDNAFRLEESLSSFGGFFSIEKWISDEGDANVYKLIIGPYDSEIEDLGKSRFSGAIIILSIWIMMFITWSDIIAGFSTFNRYVSWTIGFLMTVIFAQLGWPLWLFKWFVGTLAVVGGVAIWIGLAFAFIAFLGFNVGIGKFREWAYKRQGAIMAARVSAGGDQAASTIEALMKMAKELKDGSNS